MLISDWTNKNRLRRSYLRLWPLQTDVSETVEPSQQRLSIRHTLLFSSSCAWISNADWKTDQILSKKQNQNFKFVHLVWNSLGWKLVSTCLGTKLRQVEKETSNKMFCPFQAAMAWVVRVVTHWTRGPGFILSYCKLFFSILVLGGRKRLKTRWFKIVRCMHT